MKRTIIVATVAVMLASTGSLVCADEYVRGYTKRDGTYVAPYTRSDRDSSYNNNWSVQGNTNPYTGESGTKSRTYNDRTPSYNNETYGNPGYSNSYGGNNSSSSERRSRGLYGY